MKRCFSTGRKPLKAGRRKAKAAKPPYAPKAARFHKSPAAREETEVARLRRELSEALEQQTATAEVLSVISSSPGDLKPVFNTMLENAVRICEAKFGNLFLYEKNSFRIVAQQNPPPAYAERWGREPVLHIGKNSQNPLTTLAATRGVVHIADLTTEPGYVAGEPRMVTLVESAGARTHLLVPMLKEDELVGGISIYRQEVLPFTDKQVELLTNFAAQAVIAIENTRLLSELRESLQQQTATSDVLKVISSSPGELEPVFQAMLQNATRLCGASYSAMWLCEGDGFRSAALYGALPAAWQQQWRTKASFHVHPDAPAFRAIKTRKPVHVVDLSQTAAYREGANRWW
jgi:hypothetical protein